MHAFTFSSCWKNDTFLPADGKHPRKIPTAASSLAVSTLLGYSWHDRYLSQQLQPQSCHPLSSYSSDCSSHRFHLPCSRHFPILFNPFSNLPTVLETSLLLPNFPKRQINGLCYLNLLSLPRSGCPQSPQPAERNS